MFTGTGQGIHKETVERENIGGALPGPGSIGDVKGKPSVTLFIM